MSVPASTWAWKHSRAKGNDLLVLLAVADAANNDGGRSCQSAATMSKMTRLSVRTVQRVLARLVESGELVVEGRDAKYQTNVYRMPGVALEGPVPLRQDDAPSNCRYDKTDTDATSKTPERYDTAVSPYPSNPTTNPNPSADADGGQDSLFLDEVQTVTVEVVETPDPWEVIAKRAYDATKGALPYMGMRAIAKWAMTKGGHTAQATEDAMAALYENGQAVTKQSVAQVLDGVRTPGRSANRSMDRVAGNLSLAERIARGQA